MAMSSKEYARLARLALPISISVTPTAYRPRRGSAQRADEGVDPDARDRRGLGWRHRVGHEVPGPRAEPDRDVLGLILGASVLEQDVGDVVALEALTRIGRRDLVVLRHDRRVVRTRSEEHTSELQS